MTKLRSTLLSLSLAVATGLVFLQPAHASEPKKVEAVAERLSEPTTQVSVAAVKTAVVSFEAPVIKSVAAPVIVEAPAAPAVVAPKSTPQVTSTKAAPKPAAPVQAAQAAPAVSAPVASGRGAALLASAKSQIGQIQDCTAMVERALGSIGIITGDLAPAQFFRFGSVVSNPQPGDILISAGHVGIYAGNGMMVSGGFNGNQTVLHPVSYVGGFTAVRV